MLDSRSQLERTNGYDIRTKNKNKLSNLLLKRDLSDYTISTEGIFSDEFTLAEDYPSKEFFSGKQNNNNGGGRWIGKSLNLLQSLLNIGKGENYNDKLTKDVEVDETYTDESLDYTLSDDCENSDLIRLIEEPTQPTLPTTPEAEVINHNKCPYSGRLRKLADLLSSEQKNETKDLKKRKQQHEIRNEALSDESDRLDNMIKLMQKNYEDTTRKLEESKKCKETYRLTMENRIAKQEKIKSQLNTRNSSLKARVQKLEMKIEGKLLKHKLQSSDFSAASSMKDFSVYSTAVCNNGSSSVTRANHPPYIVLDDMPLMSNLGNDITDWEQEFNEMIESNCNSVVVDESEELSRLERNLQKRGQESIVKMMKKVDVLDSISKEQKNEIKDLQGGQQEQEDRSVVFADESEGLNDRINLAIQECQKSNDQFEYSKRCASLKAEVQQLEMEIEGQSLEQRLQTLSSSIDGLSVCSNISVNSSHHCSLHPYNALDDIPLLLDLNKEILGWEEEFNGMVGFNWNSEVESDDFSREQEYDIKQLQGEQHHQEDQIKLMIQTFENIKDQAEYLKTCEDIFQIKTKSELSTEGNILSHVPKVSLEGQLLVQKLQSLPPSSIDDLDLFSSSCNDSNVNSALHCQSCNANACNILDVLSDKYSIGGEESNGKKRLNWNSVAERDSFPSPRQREEQLHHEKVLKAKKRIYSLHSISMEQKNEITTLQGEHEYQEYKYAALDSESEMIDQRIKLMMQTYDSTKDLFEKSEKCEDTMRIKMKGRLAKQEKRVFRLCAKKVSLKFKIHKLETELEQQLPHEQKLQPLPTAPSSNAELCNCSNSCDNTNVNSSFQCEVSSPYNVEDDIPLSLDLENDLYGWEQEFDKLS